MKQFTILAFYKFVRLGVLKNVRLELLSLCNRLNLKGTVLVATEGVNGTIAGSDKSIKDFEYFLHSEERFSGTEIKKSYAQEIPFYRLKVLIKKEIVTLKAPEADPTQKVGTYVSPEKWNNLIRDPDILLVDTRNDFEYRIGTFKGAVNPQTKSFWEFPYYVHKNLDPTKHKKVAMFCTGGIRCEKATSYMLNHGFEEVYHLKGGILKYLEEIPQENSLWEGECFVFDNRVALEYGLKSGTYELCHGCGNPIGPKERRSEKYEKGVSCPYCYDNLTHKKIAANRERQHQVELAQKQGKEHIGQQIASANHRHPHKS